MARTKRIELDEETALGLERRAAERGLSVSALVAEFVALGNAPVFAGAADIAELDRRWGKVESGQATIPNADVVRWLETWGKPAFKSWHELGRRFV